MSYEKLNDKKVVKLLLDYCRLSGHSLCRCSIDDFKGTVAELIDNNYWLINRNDLELEATEDGDVILSEFDDDDLDDDDFGSLDDDDLP